MKPYYYVYRSDELRGPKIKHYALADAQAEAERLASQHPGSVFEILKCLAITRCTHASTFWMDGEEPPEKPRYRDLEDGEDFQEGDEWQPSPGIEWLKVPYYSLGEIYHKSVYPLPHRRPL